MAKVDASETTGSAPSTTDESIRKKSVWSDVPRRLTTICIGVPFVWKLLERPTTAYIFFFGAHALSAWEYTLLEPSFATEPKQALSKTTRFLFCATSLLLAAIPDASHSVFSLAASLVAGIFAMANRHHWIVGLMVVTLPFRSWCNLAYGPERDPSSFASTVAILLTVWNADTGALVAGRLLGRKRKSNKLPEWIRRISPAKTLEGFVGGILGGTTTALWAVPMLLKAFSMTTSPAFCKLWGLTLDEEGSLTLRSDSAVNRLVLGFCLSVLAILGDLVESSIKRKSQSKDSGSVLPGHGGILDRFDSSLLAVLFYRFILEQATSMTTIHDAHTATQEGNMEL